MGNIKIKSNLVLMVVAAAFALTLFRPAPASGQFYFMENEDIGKEIKDFTLKMVNGEEGNLKKYLDGKKGVVFFWATWCPHCVKELQVLNNQKDDIAKKGIKLVLVDVGEDEGIVGRYLKKKNIEMDVFLDEDSEVSDAYGLIGVPTFYFVDDKGMVADVKHSLPDDLEKVFQ